MTTAVTRLRRARTTWAAAGWYCLACIGLTIWHITGHDYSWPRMAVGSAGLALLAGAAINCFRWTWKAHRMLRNPMIFLAGIQDLTTPEDHK